MAYSIRQILNRVLTDDDVVRVVVVENDDALYVTEDTAECLEAEEAA